jgi:hypothetical protein
VSFARLRLALAAIKVCRPVDLAARPLAGAAEVVTMLRGQNCQKEDTQILV